MRLGAITLVASGTTGETSPRVLCADCGGGESQCPKWPGSPDDECELSTSGRIVYVKTNCKAPSFINELSQLLADVGARVTFDRRRSSAHPCWRCDTTEKPRSLVTIGHYARPVGGGIAPGDPIDRPLCEPCEQATRREGGS